MTMVMIAEDDLMLADMLQDTLVTAGYTVCGIARTVAQAVTLATAHLPDLAVLDVRLAHGDLGTTIVPLLPRRIGILYATGNDSIPLTQADGDVCIQKPYLPGDMLGALEVVQQIVSGHAISSRTPPGMRVLS